MHTNLLILLLFLSISTQIQSLKLKTSKKVVDWDTYYAVPGWVPADPPKFPKQLLNSYQLKNAATLFKLAMEKTLPLPPKGNGEFVLVSPYTAWTSKNQPNKTMKEAYFFGLIGPFIYDYTGKKITVTFVPSWTNNEKLTIFEDLNVGSMKEYLLKRWKEQKKITPPFTDKIPDIFYNSKKLDETKTFAQNGVPDYATVQIAYDKLKITLIPDWILKETKFDFVLESLVTVDNVISDLIYNKLKNTSPTPPTGDGNFFMICNNKNLDGSKSLIENGIKMNDKCVLSYTGEKILISFKRSWLNNDYQYFEFYRGINCRSMMNYIMNLWNDKHTATYFRDKYYTAYPIVNMDKTFKENGIKAPHWLDIY